MGHEKSKKSLTHRRYEIFGKEVRVEGSFDIPVSNQSDEVEPFMAVLLKRSGTRCGTINGQTLYLWVFGNLCPNKALCFTKVSPLSLHMLRHSNCFCSDSIPLSQNQQNFECQSINIKNYQ